MDRRLLAHRVERKPLPVRSGLEADARGVDGAGSWDAIDTPRTRVSTGELRPFCATLTFRGSFLDPEHAKLGDRIRRRGARRREATPAARGLYLRTTYGRCPAHQAWSPETRIR